MKQMKKNGAFSLVIGIVVTAVGVACGVCSIINGISIISKSKKD